jgi:hypothetical protein
MNQENHRRDTRVDARVPVVVLRGKTAASHETRDVSYRGLFVATRELPPLRSLVRLRVTLPSHTFDVHAMVVHVVEGLDEETGVGLQFWGLSGPDRRAWDAFVRKLMQLQQSKLKTNQLRIQTPHPAGTEPVSGVRVVSTGTSPVPETGSGQGSR